MSTTIDSRVVEMRFDNKQFESNVQTSLSTLDKLKNSLNMNGATKSFEQIDSAAKKVNMLGLGNAVETVRLKFSALEVMAVTALTNITNSAINAGKRLVDSFAIEPIRAGFQEYETQIGAIQTILANTSHQGTNLQQVNRALDELNLYADKTIYNFTEMTRNIGTFTAAGVDLQTSVDSIKGIANLAAVSGSTSQQASTAMYQLSQALAAGRVSLMDWNSVVNAGMGGKVFQDALVRTSELLGTGAEAAINAYGSFRESLTKGEWLTTQVLTETLKQFAGAYDEADLMLQGFTADQAKSIAEMAETAENAATKVKTFTQLFDTLKESVQSGWTQTWEIVIGDFEEAKDVLSEVSDVVGGVISRFSDARNKILGGGLSSGWKQLLDAGIADEAGYIDSIREVARANSDIFDAMVDDSDNFSSALKKGLTDGVVSANTLSEAVYHLRDKMMGMTLEEREAAGYTSDMVTKIEELAVGLQNGSISMEEFTDKILRPSGRENLIASLWNVAKGLFGIISPIKEAIIDIFPPITAENLYRITESLRSFTERLRISDEAAEKLRTTFRGIFSVADIFVTFIKGALKTSFDVLHRLFGLTNVDLLGVMSTAGAYITKLRDWIKENGVITKAMGAVADKIVLVANKIKNWVSEFKKLPDVQNMLASFGKVVSGISSGLGTYFSNAVTRIKEFISRVRDMGSLSLDNVTLIFKDFKDNVVDYFLGISEHINGLGELINSFKTGIKTRFESIGDSIDWLKDKIGPFLEKLSDFRKAFNDNIGLGEILTIGVGAGVIVALKKFGDIMDVFSGGFSIVESFEKILSGVQGALSAFTKQENSKAFLNVALSIGVLAASVALLTKIDPTRLWPAIGAITTLAVEMLAISGAMSLVGKNLSSGSGVGILAAVVSIKVFAGVLEDLDGIKLNDPSKVIWTLIGAIASLAILSAVCKSVKLGSAVGVIGIVAGLKLLVGVFDDFARLDYASLSAGIGTIAKIFAMYAALLVSSKFGGANVAKAGVGILAMSAALIVVMSAVKMVAKTGRSDLSKATDTLSGILLLFGVMIGMSGLAGPNAAKAGAMVLLISGALVVLSGAIVILSHIKPDGLKQAVGAIAALEVLFMGLIAVTALAKDCKSTIISITAVIGVLAVAIGVFSLVNQDNLKNATVSLSLVMGMFALMLSVTSIAKPAIGAITTMAVVVAELAAIIYVLSSLPVDSVLTTALSLSALLLALSASFAIAGSVGMFSAAAYGAITVMTLVVAGLAAIIGVLASFDVGPTLEIAISLSTLLLSMSAACAILSVVGAAGPSAFVGIAALAALIAGIGGIIVGVGALVQNFPDMELFVTKGISLLEQISHGIGSFAGNIIGGFVGGLSSALPDIADNLSSFIDNMQPFFKGVSKIDADAISGVRALAETILILTGVNLLDKLTSWFTGGSSLSKFADELVPFGAAMKEFSDEINGLDGETVKNAAAAGKVLAEMASTVPNSGGFVGRFMGENDLDTFGSRLVPFGKAMKEYSLAVVGIDADVVQNSAAAGSALMELASTVPNSGGFVGRFMGENDLDTFGSRLVPFGKAMKEYSLAVVGIDADVVTNSANAATALAELARNLPNSGGFVGRFMGDNDMSTFGSHLSSFGTSFSKYYDSVSAINVVKLQGTTSAFSNLLGVLSDAKNIDSKAVDGFASSLHKLGSTGVDSFIGAFANAHSRVTFAASDFINAFAVGVATYSGNLKTIFTDMVSKCVDAVRDKIYEFESIGGLCITRFIAGLKLKSDVIHKQFASILSNAISLARSYYDDFYEIGQYLVDGFAAGIDKNTWKAAAKAGAMARAAAEASRKELDERSPSKVSYEIGDFYGKGFVNALVDYYGKVYKASSSLAASAKDGLSDTISKISDFINGNLDAAPTITPVLDLSDVQSKAGLLTSILSRSQALKLASSINSKEPGSIQNGNNEVEASGATYSFTQNNYSPKALSRVEIYRQTRNQFSAMERMIKA